MAAGEWKNAANFPFTLVSSYLFFTVSSMNCKCSNDLCNGNGLEGYWYQSRSVPSHYTTATHTN